jgi:hypothetical protein
MLVKLCKFSQFDESFLRRIFGTKRKERKDRENCMKNFLIYTLHQIVYYGSHVKDEIGEHVESMGNGRNCSTYTLFCRTTLKERPISETEA